MTRPTVTGYADRQAIADHPLNCNRAMDQIDRVLGYRRDFDNSRDGGRRLIGGWGRRDGKHPSDAVLKSRQGVTA